MKDRNSFRGYGITKEFAQTFRESKFYSVIYQQHKDEIIIGVRDGYICLYYNCDCIAKIVPSDKLVAEIDAYYTDGATALLTEEEIVQYFAMIKSKSDARHKLEKQAQQRLFIQNNNSRSSGWFCVDVEFTKSLRGRREPEPWRFDIIAISASQPYQIALIELKYGAGALKEPSGIRTHIKDFHVFHTQDSHSEFNYEGLKKEVISMIRKQSLLGVPVPKALDDLTEEKIADQPAYFIITLNNNPICDGGSTPKQTMSGYLFKDKRWGCKRVSRWVNKEGDYFSLIGNDDSFVAQFLFSKGTLPNLGISDIIDDEGYERELVTHKPTRS